MSVWYAVPSIRPNGGTLPRWREMGYKLAVLRQGEACGADIEIPTGEYKGWAPSVNILAKEVLRRDPLAQWVVSGGDDYLPDPAHSPGEISAQCAGHFGRMQNRTLHIPASKFVRAEDVACSTFGVMQPTGDRWQDSADSREMFGEGRGAVIDRIAGSPWMGREWCERAYQGNGPMFGGYFHNFADEDLQEVATKLRVFWQCRDITQFHDHWARARGHWEDAPEFAKFINGPEYQQSEPLFKARKAAGFPGCEPLMVAA